MDKKIERFNDINDTYYYMKDMFSIKTLIICVLMFLMIYYFLNGMKN